MLPVAAAVHLGLEFADKVKNVVCLAVVEAFEQSSYASSGNGLPEPIFQRIMRESPDCSHASLPLAGHGPAGQQNCVASTKRILDIHTKCEGFQMTAFTGRLHPVFGNKLDAVHCDPALDSKITPGKFGTRVRVG